MSAMRRRRIAEILRTQTAPSPSDDDALFSSLQASYGPRDIYKYGPFHTWRRGSQRALALLKHAQLQASALDVLEVGCGDGMVGRMLESYGHNVTLLDLEDWRDERAKHLPLIQLDLGTSLDLESERYDLVYSYNTCEHMPDPELAFREMLRICRRGGVIHLEFGPLYASPWGLHASGTIHVPYPQYLFSRALVDRKLSELGVFDLGRALEKPQHLNEWRVAQFRALWNDAAVEIVELVEAQDSSHLGLVLRFPQAFQGRGLSLEDLTAHTIVATLRKR